MSDTSMTLFGSGFLLDEETCEVAKNMSGLEAKLWLRELLRDMPTKEHRQFEELFREMEQSENPSLKNVAIMTRSDPKHFQDKMATPITHRSASTLKQAYTLAILTRDISAEENNYNLRRLINMSFADKKYNTLLNCIKLGMQVAHQFEERVTVQNVNIVNINPDISKLLLGKMERRDEEAETVDYELERE